MADRALNCMYTDSYRYTYSYHYISSLNIYSQLQKKYTNYLILQKKALQILAPISIQTIIQSITRNL